MHKIFQASTISSIVFIKNNSDELLHLKKGAFSWLTATGAKKSLQAHFFRITVNERPLINKNDLLNHGWVVRCSDGKLHYIIDEVEYEFNNHKDLVAKLFELKILEIVQVG